MFAAFLPVPNRVAFTVFGLDIMWYAIMLVSGMICGTILDYKRAPKKGLSSDMVLDLVLYCVPAGVIGSRIYYVAFEWENYKNNLKDIINIRNGGLAIHGGLLFGLGLMVFLVLRKKQNFIDWLDIAVPGIALAQAIGRWGNYFNSEAHGTPTDLPWAIECQGELVHPTFLYESVWCLLLCIFLCWFDNRNIRKGTGFKGQIFCLYGILYSVERFFVEGLRTDSLYLDAERTIKQAQVISASIIVAGIILYFALKKVKWPEKKEEIDNETYTETESDEETNSQGGTE